MPVSRSLVDRRLIGKQHVVETEVAQIANTHGIKNAVQMVAFVLDNTGVEVAYRPEKDDGTLDAAIRKGYDLETLKSDYAAPSNLG
jgi:hypothetical protein